MFAYCGNNPVNRADSSGQFWGIVVGITLVVGLIASLSGCSVESETEAYSSADDAAKSFATNTYSSSEYTRHEYVAEIYSETKNGKTSYYLTETRVGTPHGGVISNSYIPKGGKMEAYVHTHPNSNYFSSPDKDTANYFNVNAYVIGPNLELKRYNYSDGSTSFVESISPVSLTDEQMGALDGLRASWDAHFVDGVCPKGFGCEYKSWPNR